MKLPITILVILITVSCQARERNRLNTQNENSRNYLFEKEQNPLLNIQESIFNAFVKSIMAKDNTPLNLIDVKLSQLYQTNKHDLILYWHTYLQYYSAIYHLEIGDKKGSEKEIDRGIDYIKSIKSKNSEDYALLALLQSFSIQFKGISAPFIAQRVKKNARKAIAIDSSNLRAYFVYASNDFYTPSKYGGGKKAEEYLLKAISLKEQTIKNDFLPSWGKEEAYEMLIKLYIKKENWQKAKTYFQEGITVFPKSYAINQLASELVGK